MESIVEDADIKAACYQDIEAVIDRDPLVWSATSNFPMTRLAAGMRHPERAYLAPLVGRWRTELHRAAFLPEPDATVTGSINIDWVEGGAASAMRQGDSEHPSAAF
jgi:hypothetical protein